MKVACVACRVDGKKILYEFQSEDDDLVEFNVSAAEGVYRVGAKYSIELRETLDRAKGR